MLIKKYNYIYIIHLSGKISYGYDLTWLKFTILDHDSYLLLNNKVLYFLEELIITKTKSKLLYLLWNDCNKIPFFIFLKGFNTVFDLHKYDLMVLNNQFINDLLSIDLYKNRKYSLIKNIFFNY